MIDARGDDRYLRLGIGRGEARNAMKVFADQHMEGSLNATPAPIEITAQERDIDRVLADSFPASDSPPWTLGVLRDPANESANMDASAKSHPH
jgi:hypothetical protein